MVPTILDFEASGFGAESYPIEVGLAMSNGERFCTLIQRHASWTHWDPEAERVHHIEQDDLQRYGLPVVDVCTKLNELLQNQAVYCDGWSVDKPWLNVLFYAAGFAPTFSLSPIESIQTENQQEVWASVKQELILRHSYERHRASHDAFLIQETFKASKDLRYNRYCAG